MPWFMDDQSIFHLVDFLLIFQPSHIYDHCYVSATLRGPELSNLKTPGLGGSNTSIEQCFVGESVSRQTFVDIGKLPHLQERIKKSACLGKVDEILSELTAISRRKPEVRNGGVLTASEEVKNHRNHRNLFLGE